MINTEQLKSFKKNLLKDDEQLRIDKNTEEFKDSNNPLKHPINYIKNAYRESKAMQQGKDYNPTDTITSVSKKAKPSNYNSQANANNNPFGKVFNPTGGHSAGCKQYAYEVALNMGAKGVKGKWDGSKASGYTLQFKRNNGKIVQTTIDDFFKNGGGITVTKNNTKGLKNGDVVWLNGGSHSAIAYQGADGQWYINENSTPSNGKPVRQNTRKLFSFGSVQYGRPIYDRPQAIFNTPQSKPKPTQPLTQKTLNNVIANLWNNGFGEQEIKQHIKNEFNLNDNRSIRAFSNWKAQYDNNVKNQQQQQKIFKAKQGWDNKSPEEQKLSIDIYKSIYNNGMEKADSYLTNLANEGKDFDQLTSAFAKKYNVADIVAIQYISEWNDRYNNNHPAKTTEQLLNEIFSQAQANNPNLTKENDSKVASNLYASLNQQQALGISKDEFNSAYFNWVDRQRQINKSIPENYKKELAKGLEEAKNKWGIPFNEIQGKYIDSNSTAVDLNNYILTYITKEPEKAMTPENLKKLQKQFPNIEKGKLFHALQSFSKYGLVKTYKQLGGNTSKVMDDLAVYTTDRLANITFAMTNKWMKYVPMIDMNIIKEKYDVNPTLIDEVIGDVIYSIPTLGLGSGAGLTKAVTKGAQLATKGGKLMAYGKRIKSVPTVIQGYGLAKTGRTIKNVGNVIKSMSLGTNLMNLGFDTYATKVAENPEAFNKVYDKDNPLSWLYGMATEKVMQKAQTNAIKKKHAEDAIKIAEGLNKLHIDHSHISEGKGWKGWVDNVKKGKLKYLAESLLGSFILVAPELVGGKSPSTVANMIQAYRGSATVESAMKYLELLQEAGVDLGDVNQLQDALTNPKKYNDLKLKSSLRGFGVGAFDALSVALAGKVLGARTGKFTNIMARQLQDTAIQAGLGGAGEAFGSLIIGEKPDARDILDEAFGEVVPGVYESALNYNNEIIEANKEWIGKLPKVEKTIIASAYFNNQPNRFKQIGFKQSDLTAELPKTTIDDAHKYLGDKFKKEDLDKRLGTIYEKMANSEASNEEIKEYWTLAVAKRTLEERNRYIIKEDTDTEKSKTVELQPQSNIPIVLKQKDFVIGDTVIFADGENLVAGQIENIDKENNTVTFKSDNNVYENVPMEQLNKASKETTNETIRTTYTKQDLIDNPKIDIGKIKPYDISINKENQFRETPNGVVDNRLDNVKTLDDWNTDYAGSINIYYNKDTKQIEVYNGHHRLQKLQELIYDAGKKELEKLGVVNPTKEQIIAKGEEIAEAKGKNVIKFLKDNVDNSDEANIKGALINLSNGTVTAWDMANFLRQGRKDGVVNNKVIEYIKRNNPEIEKKYKTDKSIVNNIFDVLNLNEDGNINSYINGMLYLPNVIFNAAKPNIQVVAGRIVENKNAWSISEKEGSMIGQRLEHHLKIHPDLMKQLEENDGKLAEQLLHNIRKAHDRLKVKELDETQIRNRVDAFIEMRNKGVDLNINQYTLWEVLEPEEYADFVDKSIMSASSLLRGLFLKIASASKTAKVSSVLGIKFTNEEIKNDFPQIYKLLYILTQPETTRLNGLNLAKTKEYKGLRGEIEKIINKYIKEKNTDYSSLVKDISKTVLEFTNNNKALKNVLGGEFKGISKESLKKLFSLVDIHGVNENPFSVKSDLFHIDRLYKELGFDKTDTEPKPVEEPVKEEPKPVTEEELKSFLTKLQKKVGYKFTKEEQDIIQKSISKITTTDNIKSLPSDLSKGITQNIDKNSVISAILHNAKVLGMNNDVAIKEDKTDKLYSSGYCAYEIIEPELPDATHGATVNGINTVENHIDRDRTRYSADILNRSIANDERIATKIQNLFGKKFTKAQMEKFVGLVNIPKNRYKLAPDYFNSIDIVAHETGHILANILGFESNVDRAIKNILGNNDIEYIKEMLKEFADGNQAQSRFSSYNSATDKEAYQINEGFAEAWRNYLEGSYYISNSSYEDLVKFFDKAVKKAGISQRDIREIRKLIEKKSNSYNGRYLTATRKEFENIAENIYKMISLDFWQKLNIEKVDRHAGVRYALENAIAKYNEENPIGKIENEKQLVKNLLPYMMLRNSAGYRGVVKLEYDKLNDVYKEMLVGADTDIETTYKKIKQFTLNEEFDFAKDFYNNISSDYSKYTKPIGLLDKQLKVLQHQLEKELSKTDYETSLEDIQTPKQNTIEDLQNQIAEKEKLIEQSYLFQKEIVSKIDKSIIKDLYDNLSKRKKQIIQNELFENLKLSLEDKLINILNNDLEIDDVGAFEFLKDINEDSITDQEFLDLLQNSTQTNNVKNVKDAFNVIIERAKRKFKNARNDKAKTQVISEAIFNLENIVYSKNFKDYYTPKMDITSDYESSEFKRYVVEQAGQKAVQKYYNNLVEERTEHYNSSDNLKVANDNLQYFLKSDLKKMSNGNSIDVKNNCFVDYMLAKREVKELKNNSSYDRQLRNVDRLAKIKELEQLIKEYEFIFDNFKRSSIRFYATYHNFTMTYRLPFMRGVLRDKVANELIYDNDGYVIDSKYCYVPFNLAIGNVLGDRVIGNANRSKALKGSYDNSTVFQNWQERIAETMDYDVKRKWTNDARKSFFKTMDSLGIGYDIIDKSNQQLMLGDLSLLELYQKQFSKIMPLIETELASDNINNVDFQKAKEEIKSNLINDTGTVHEEKINYINDLLDNIATVKAYEKVLNADGIDLFSINKMEQNIMDIAKNKVVISDYVKDLNPNIDEYYVTTWENGRPVMREVIDEYLRQGLLNEEFHNRIVGIDLLSNFWNDFFKFFAKGLREGTSLAYQFIVNNFLRDTTHTAMASKGNFVPIVGSVAGGVEYFRDKGKGKVNTDFIKSGGSLSGIASYRTTSDENFTKTITLQSNNQFVNVYKNFVKGWLSLREGSENATRIGNFMATKKYFMDKYGFDEDTANIIGAYYSRDITDWGMKGTDTGFNEFISTVAFLRTTINSNAYLWHNATNTNWKKFVGKICLIGATQSMLGLLEAVLYKDDDDYKNLSDYIIDNYILIKNPFNKNAHRFLKIPIPFELGKLFILPFKRLAYEITGARPNYSLSKGLYSALNTFTSPVPTFAWTILQLFTNKDFFTGNNIEPFYQISGQTEKNKSDIYNSNTPLFARDLGKYLSSKGITNVPIAKAMFFADNLCGTFGADVIDLLDFIYSSGKNSLIGSGKLDALTVDSKIENTEEFKERFNKFMTRQNIYSAWYNRYIEYDKKLNKDIASQSANIKEAYKTLIGDNKDMPLKKQIRKLKKLDKLPKETQNVIERYKANKELLENMEDNKEAINKNIDIFYNTEDKEEKHKAIVEISRESLKALINGNDIPEDKLYKYVKNKELIKY